MMNTKDPHRLEIYSETQRSRIFVGLLSFDPSTQVFTFEYDRTYMKRKAIPIGPDLPLRRRTHQSKKNRLFSSIEDRIPSRENPAYEEYCRSQGIDPKERNEILLLGTIGRRGPSTFIFEPLYFEEPIGTLLVAFRKQLDLTLREFATVFDLNYPTLSKLETGKSKDRNTTNLIRIFIAVPEAALSRVQINQRKIHSQVAHRLMKLFQSKAEQARRQLEL
jgi:plasmid maintenance system antidote protein VapI